MPIENMIPPSMKRVKNVHILSSHLGITTCRENATLKTDTKDKAKNCNQTSHVNQTLTCPRKGLVPCFSMEDKTVARKGSLSYLADYMYKKHLARIDRLNA